MELKGLGWEGLSTFGAGDRRAMGSESFRVGTPLTYLSSLPCNIFLMKGDY